MKTIETVWKVSTKIIRPRSREFRFWKNPKLPISSRISSVSITEGLPAIYRPLKVLWPLLCSFINSHLTQRDAWQGYWTCLWRTFFPNFLDHFFLFAKHKQRISFKWQWISACLFYLNVQWTTKDLFWSFQFYARINALINWNPDPPPPPRQPRARVGIWLDTSLQILTNPHPTGAYWLVKPPPLWGNRSCSLTDYSDTHCLQTILLIFKFCQPQNKRILCFDSQ